MHTVSTFEQLGQLLSGRRTCLTIGVFDGVHIGHQALISETITAARAHGDVPVGVTFRNHPLSVLAPPYTPRRLVTTARKTDLLGALGIEIVVMLDFTSTFATTPAAAFIEDFLVRQAHVRTLICGYDFTFGSRGAGNIDMLRQLGEQWDFHVQCVQPVNHENHIVKSTHVRDLLSNGNVAQAALLLTRPHEVPGKVISGMQRGRTIGFPTANLQVPENYQVPARGVYTCAARVADEPQIHPAMVNIGTSPTFGENALSVEAYILSFNHDIHGQPLSLFFLEKLRDEQKFSGVPALVEQLQKDQAQTQQLWQSPAIQNLVAKIPGPLTIQ